MITYEEEVAKLQTEGAGMSPPNTVIGTALPDDDEVKRIGDQIALLNAGQMVQLGRYLKDKIGLSYDEDRATRRIENARREPT